MNGRGKFIALPNEIRAEEGDWHSDTLLVLVDNITAPRRVRIEEETQGTSVSTAN